MKTIELNQTEIAILQTKVTELSQEISERDKTILCLKEQLAWFKRQIFGKRSERIVSDLNDQQLTFEGFESFPAPKDEEKK